MHDQGRHGGSRATCSNHARVGQGNPAWLGNMKGRIEKSETHVLAKAAMLALDEINAATEAFDLRRRWCLACAASTAGRVRVNPNG